MYQPRAYIKYPGYYLSFFFLACGWLLNYQHQALILGKTEHNFSFPVNNSIDIFGMTIDNRLSFDNHVSVICKKINNQFNVMLRFRKLINKETLLKLYKAFILPHFYYCSSVWHFCGARNADKVDNLNKRIQSIFFSPPPSPFPSFALAPTVRVTISTLPYLPLSTNTNKVSPTQNTPALQASSPYDILLSKVNMKSLFIRRLQNFLICYIRVCSLRIIQFI